MNALAKFFAMLFVIFIVILLRGFIITYFWKWFISDPFKMQEISFAHGLGLALFISFILYKYKKKKEEPDKEKEFEKWIQKATTYIFFSLFIWGLGWLLTIWI